MAVYDKEEPRDLKIAPSDDDLRAIAGVSKAEDAAINEQAMQPKTLGDQENATGKQSLYKPFGEKMDIKSIRISKRQGGLLGSVVALAAALMIGVSTLGPLQFIHFAQLLQSFHFSDQENATNGRIKKLLIYSKTKDVTKTRLGFIANAQANNIDKKLKLNGWEIKSTSVGNFDGFEYDPRSNKNAPATKEEIAKSETLKASLEKQGIKTGAFDTKTGTFKTPPDSMKYWSNRSLIKTIYSGNRDVGKITSAYEKRILIKRAGLTFNPLTKLNNKIKQSISERIQQERERRLTGRETPPEVQKSTQETDKKAPKDGVTPEQAANEADNLKAQAKKGTLTSESLKVASGKAVGIAGVVGLLCMAKSIAEQVDSARTIAVQMPMMRASAEVLGVGSKVMAGDDVDMKVLSEYAKSLSSNTKTNKSSWAGARTIQYEQGKPNTGTTLPSELNPQPSESEITSAIDGIPGIDSICQVAENKVVMFVTTVATGVASIATYALQQVLAGPVIGKIISLFTPSVINLASEKYAGAPYGEAVNVGSRLVANETSFSMGGRVLSGSEELALKEQTNKLETENNQTRSIADRYLNPYKYDSSASQLIDSINPNDIGGSVAKIPSLIANALLSPFAKKAVAATSESPEKVYYGISKVGFAPGTLDTAENPYTNASNAKDILLGANGQKYIDILKKCNKIDAVVSAENLDFTSEQGGGDAPATIGSYDKLPMACKDDSDKKLLTVRIAAFDTITMKSFACTEFNDEQSCSDIGVSN